MAGGKITVTAHHDAHGQHDRWTSRAWRVPLAYAVVATGWIYISDRALVGVVTDESLFLRWSIIKGLAFVFVTTALLYVLIRRDFVRADLSLDVLALDTEQEHRVAEALRRTLALQQQANEELTQVAALRDRFLTAVSHELRTPLTVVQGLSELLRRFGDRLDVAERTQMLDRLDANARQLSLLLEDLLDLNRLNAGRLVIQAERRDLGVLVVEAVAEVDVGGHACTVETVACEVDVEPSKIRRVLVNLVRNAVVHTPPGTPITVSMRARGGTVQVRCSDSGSGVADGQKSRIFAPFEQGDSLQTHQPGTGIGLSLAKEFVRLHDGQLWVEDTPGGGATFIMELPRVARTEV
ncbi:MAG: HAMP domain-containing sensor histidine kinase [Nitriliruptoraceae bacterium]